MQSVFKIFSPDYLYSFSFLRIQGTLSVLFLIF